MQNWLSFEHTIQFNCNNKLINNSLLSIHAFRRDLQKMTCRRVQMLQTNPLVAKCCRLAIDLLATQRICCRDGQAASLQQIRVMWFELWNEHRTPRRKIWDVQYIHIYKTVRNVKLKLSEALTVRCSSPLRTLNLCSKMAYMMRPIPNEGSMTDGTNSSTELNKQNYIIIHVQGV
jgi:hypothetical protein